MLRRVDGPDVMRRRDGDGLGLGRAGVGARVSVCRRWGRDEERQGEDDKRGEVSG